MKSTSTFSSPPTDQPTHQLTDQPTGHELDPFTDHEIDQTTDPRMEPPTNLYLNLCGCYSYSITNNHLYCSIYVTLIREAEIANQSVSSFSSVMIHYQSFIILI